MAKMTTAEDLEKLKRDKRNDAGHTGGTILTVVFFLVCYGAYWQANQWGWIPHSDNIQVDFPVRQWEVGEYVDCYATRLDDKSPVILACNGNEANSQFREMDVRIWAKVEPTKDGTPVKCQRLQDSITCHLSK